MTLPPPQDRLDAEDLARRAQEGSSACFASLVSMYQDRLFNFLLRRSRTRADAEDLTQDTFVRAWEKIQSYKPEMRFSTWLFTIGSRLASNHRRDTRRVRSGLATEPPVHLEPSAPAEAREEHRRVWSLVDNLLNEQQRAAIWLRYAEGLEPAEIAQVLGKTGIGVRVLLFRARERLTGALADECSHPHRAEGPGPALQCAQSLGGAP